MCYTDDGVGVHCYDYGFMNQIDPDKHIDEVIRWANQQVKKGAAYACNVKGINTSVPRYQHWHDFAYAYFNSKAKNKQRDWGLVCAAYGYAVEEYVNIQIESNAYPYRAEFDVSTQRRSGGTIPDIVITINYTDAAGHAKSAEAWLDITSEKSLRHIYNKKGSGWRTKPIVIELAYPPLDASKLIL